MRLLTLGLRRLGRLLLTVLLVSSVVFVVLRLVPGDPSQLIAGIDAAPQDIEALRVRLGTDRSVPLQYLEWIWGVARMQFGVSLITQRPVVAEILSRLPLTLTLAFLGLLFALLLALPLGVISAVRRGSVWDQLGMAISHAGMALPSFWLGILLLLVFAVTLRWFPLFGSGRARHLVLPVVALGLSRAAILIRLTRASMLEELGREYVVTARAKGLPELLVRYKHALRNALLPVITVAGIQFGSMLGGAIIVEQVFALPGLGRLFLTAVYQRDFPLVQGGVVFVALVFSGVNFAVDLLYAAVNPRIEAR